MAKLQRQLFAPKSERFVVAPDPRQGWLFADMEGEAALPDPNPDPGEPTRRRRKPKRRPNFDALPDHLPREQLTIEPEVDTTGLRCIGTERTQILEYFPGRYKMIEILRPKYVDPSNEDGGVIIAALPPRLIDKGMAGPGLLAHVVTDKYVDHLPLYRHSSDSGGQAL